jgi:hypothetical protein
MIGESCFAAYKSLGAVIFDIGSKLSRIEAYTFSGVLLTQLMIPSAVEFISNSAFVGINQESSSLDLSATNFSLDCSWLLDRSKTSVIHQLKSFLKVVLLHVDFFIP